MFRLVFPAPFSQSWPGSGPSHTVQCTLHTASYHATCNSHISSHKDIRIAYSAVIYKWSDHKKETFLRDGSALDTTNLRHLMYKRRTCLLTEIMQKLQLKSECGLWELNLFSTSLFNYQHNLQILRGTHHHLLSQSIPSRYTTLTTHHASKNYYFLLSSNSLYIITATGERVEGQCYWCIIYFYILCPEPFSIISGFQDKLGWDWQSWQLLLFWPGQQVNYFTFLLDVDMIWYWWWRMD